MLSRWQRWLTITLALLTLTLLAIAWSLDGGVPAMLAALLVVPVGYATALALEFLMMHAVNRGDPAPRARASEVVRAWVGEVISGPVVFGWRQPWHSARWPDGIDDVETARSDAPQEIRPDAGALVGATTPRSAASSGAAPVGRLGVLFVHGFVCSRGLWNPWMQRLSATGTPFVALDLEPVFGSIDDYVPLIEAGVRRLEIATGLPPIVVAHSMGGLALRRWWAAQDRAPARSRLRHAITIGTPHHGTWLARFAFTPNGSQMRPQSDWLQSLQRMESGDGQQPPWSGRLTCFYGHCDNIVFPASSATLADADNRHLAAVAHVHMADRREPFDALQALLSQRS